MAAQSDQTEMLAVVSRIASICRQAQSKSAYSQKEKTILNQREGEILDAASALSVLISGGIESKVEQEVIFRAVKNLAMGAFDAGMITHTSDASKNFHNAKNTSKARQIAREKQSRRDEVLANELSGLIAQGLKGEKLRKRLVKIFSEQKVEPKKLEPGLRQVSTWVKQYHELGMWQPPRKS